MANSALEAIETSVVAAMLTVPGITAAKAAASIAQFNPNLVSAENDGYVWTLPDSYPGCVVSLSPDELEAKPIEGDGPANWQAANAASVAQRVPVYIAIYATSDGTSQTSARYLAWQLEEAAKQKLVLTPPSGLPAGDTPWPYEFEKSRPVVVDANTYGMLLKIWAVFKSRWIA